MTTTYETYLHPDPWRSILPRIESDISALPLVRRLQFHLQTEHATVIATFPPSESSPFPELYAITYVDRSRAPETESWWYSSVEAGPVDTRSPQGQEARKQLLSLLDHLKRLPLPKAYPATQNSSLLLAGAVHRTTLTLLQNENVSDDDGKKVISGDKGAAQANGNDMDPDKPVEDYLDPNKDGYTIDPEEKDRAPSRRVVRGFTVPYANFIFPPLIFDVGSDVDVTAGTDGLPSNLSWTKIAPEEFKLVISRTDIPRKERTLLLLPGVGIRTIDDDESTTSKAGRLIAWGFLGADSSLSSLHVEAEYRGQGLAKTLSKRVFALLTPRESLDPKEESRRRETLVLEDPRRGFFDIPTGFNQAHSHVARDNVASVAVAKALGGVDSGECFWAWFDLGAVERELSATKQQQ